MAGQIEDRWKTISDEGNQHIESKKISIESCFLKQFSFPLKMNKKERDESNKEVNDALIDALIHIFCFYLGRTACPNETSIHRVIRRFVQWYSFRS